MKKKILLSFICVFAGALSALAAARVPYALYSQGHTMLTFYYGEMPEDGYYISAQYEPGWHADGSCSEVTHVVFDSSFAQARVTSTKDWFYDMRNLVSITGLEYLKTEYVTDMSRMFSYCTRLTTLDLRDLNTDRVTDMSFMFDCASSLTSVDLSNFNTSNVNYMQCMFKYCKELSTLDLSNFNTSSVINMDYMFQNCEKLKRLDLSTFNTENVKSMQYMFYSCKALSNLNVSNFNTSKVTNMWSMFHSCTSLTSLNLSSFNTQRVTNMSAMFYDCAKLVTIYVGEEWSNAAVTSGRETFRYCTNIKGGAGTTYDENNIGSSYAHIDGGTSNPGYLTGVQPVVAYDASTKTLTFYCDGEAHTGDVGPLPYYNTSQPWWVQDTNVSANVQKVVFHPSFAHVHPTSGYYWFAGMSNLTSFEGLKYFNTDEMVNMQSMFRNCSKLTSIEGIEYLNTSKVTNMYCMFMGCTNLANLDLRSFDTGKVTNMGYMFYNCNNLTNLDLTGLNTQNVTSMLDMFGGCRKLTKLDLGAFSTAKVTDMTGMFSGCTALTTIEITDLWTTEAVTESNYMFRNCTSIRGSKGTTYDANYIDKTRAHYDNGPTSDAPGYMTPTATAYVVWDATTKKLTFYYDNLFNDHDNIYFLNTGTQSPTWLTYDIVFGATQAVFDPSFAEARPTSTAYWFAGMQELTKITGLGYLNTSEVTDMRYMFQGCEKLAALDLSHFNTSKVTNMEFMFYNCKKLTDLDLSTFNTSLVKSMNSMFRICENLITIVVGDGWNTDMTTISVEMFSDCYSLLGCKGTKYTPVHVEKGYAHIDDAPDNPGYLSDTMPRGFKYEGIWYDDGVVIAPQHGDDYTGEVVIPSKFTYKGKTYNVTHIEAGAFTGTSVTRVDLPGSISWIETGAFKDAKQLNTLVIGYSYTPAYVNYEQNFTGGNGSGFACYVPNSYLGRYEETHVNINFAPWVKISEDFYVDLHPYRAFSCKYKTVMPSGLEAYYVKGYNSNSRTAQTQKVTGIVPANTGLILKGSECKIYLLEKTGSDAATISGNLLKPYLSAADSPVGVQDDNARFYFNDTNMRWESTINLSLGGSYLCIPKSQVGSDLTSPVLLDLESSLLGDCNGDGAVNVQDVTALITYILGTTPTGFVVANANVNQDPNGTIDVQDVTALINMILE